MAIEGKCMDEQQARELAIAWIRAWNNHDLDEILEHYEDDVILTSPVAARILGDPAGTVRGKTALRAYFARGLEVYPDLKFELIEVMFGLHSVVLYYKNQKGTHSGEYMEIADSGKVSRVVANYSE
jgi:ketosteroid isomerase-like protein